MQPRVCASCDRTFTDPDEWFAHWCPVFHPDPTPVPGQCELPGCNTRLMGLRRDARYCTEAHAREARRVRRQEKRSQTFWTGHRAVQRRERPGS